MSSNGDDDDSDIDFDLTPEEEEMLKEKSRKRIEQEIKENIKEKEQKTQKQEDIKKNVCEIDYEYAVSNQTGVQKDVMKEYINIGMELNAAIRGEGGRTIDDKLDKLMKKLNENFAPIKNNKKCGSGAYYIVHRCISKGLLILKSEAYMSTSNKKLVGFGGNCVRIFVPIETPVLVGDISKTTSMSNTYEILFPIGTTLIPTDSKGDFYIETKKQAIGGRSGVKRKRSIKKKTLRIKRIKGKREKINRSKKTRR